MMVPSKSQLDSPHIGALHHVPGMIMLSVVELPGTEPMTDGLNAEYQPVGQRGAEPEVRSTRVRCECRKGRYHWVPGFRTDVSG